MTTLEDIWYSSKSDLYRIIFSHNPSLLVEPKSNISINFLRIILAKLYNNYGMINKQNWIINHPSFEIIFKKYDNLYDSFKELQIKFTIQYIWDMEPNQIKYLLQKEYTIDQIMLFGNECLTSVAVVLITNFQLLEKSDLKYVSNPNFYSYMSLLYDINLTKVKIDNINDALDKLIFETQNNRESLIDQQNREYEESVQKDLQKLDQKNEKIDDESDNKIEMEKLDPILRKERIRASWANK